MELFYQRKPNGMYIINREQIDAIADMTLREYIPSVLEYPQAVDIQNIAEDGLFLTIENRMLDWGSNILGMTAFEDVEDVPCLDDRFQQAKIDLPAGTVLIHSQLLGYENQKRRRFTLAHECSHWILHRSYYSPTNQKFQFRTQRPLLVACRAENIEKKRHDLRTDEDWIEWQADTLAAALLMPVTIFTQFASRLISGSGRRYLTLGKITPDYIEIVEEISERFLVSKTATEIRLKQVGLIQKEQKFAYAY